MAKIKKALKVRIYPNYAQKIIINKTLGCCRFLYNQMLAERISTYEKLKDDRKALYKHKYKTEKQYKEEYEWMYEADSTALQQSRIDLSNAYMNFFKSLKELRKGAKVGYPKFKKKKHSESYRTTMNCYIFFDSSKIQIAKVKKVNFRCKGIKDWYKDAKVKYITVSKSATGKYYASVLMESEQDFNGHQEVTDDIKIVGLDMSLDKFFVDQYGNSPDYQKNYRNNEKKLARTQRSYSRKINGSKNKEKARIKVAKVHEDIANKRKDFIDKLSLKLVQENDVIVVESLSLKGMSKAMKFGKSVHELGYHKFVQKLRYKSLWNDKTLIEADKWLASSKTCSYCSYVNSDLLLQQRKWTCPSCGKKLERDQNAGQNLHNYGIKEIRQVLPELTPVEFKASASIAEVSLDVEAGKVILT